jgi:cyclase
MSNIRLIARLDIKGPNLIKGVHLEGLRVIGDPQVFASKYYREGVDELIFMDAVASLYGRNNLLEIVRHTAREIFVPLTVGGGIRSVDDVYELLRAGADKVAINTAAAKCPELIKQIARRFGSQCCVLSIEAKRQSEGGWKAYIDNGREKTGMDVMEWARRGEDLGAGEILITSIDQEGTRKGMDCELINTIANSVKIPIIASGGVGSPAHVIDAITKGNADAIAIADVLHYGRYTLSEIRTTTIKSGIHVRQL